ncbi:MAG TPA: glycosyltransferase [Bacteroidetes bacterium]|nr:glycosyltransferase [Bacteroidota bacterium]
MGISVIIPTFNEEKNIAKLVKWLHQTRPDKDFEIIVVDGGSSDQTLKVAERAGATALLSPEKGRGPQMNFGVENATYGLLYFVHADVLPPKEWPRDIESALSEGLVAGCFSYQLDSDKWPLKITEWSTRQSWFAVGGGDQTMFVKREVFEELGGFRKHLLIMEDFEFVKRLRKKYRYKVIQNNALVSARKYENNSFLYVQLINGITVLLFNFGYPQERLARFYKHALRVKKGGRQLIM